MTNAHNYRLQFAETRQICGKFAACHTNVVNYVAHKANVEKTANFWRREEME